MKRDLYNRPLAMGAAKLFTQLGDGCARIAFFDPQHRDMLDRQAYGNEGNRQKGRAKLQVMDGPTIAFFIEEIERCVVPGGYLFLWVDKLILVERRWRRWFRAGPTLFAPVDLMHWNKNRIGMGRRLRWTSEFCLVLQKEPRDAKGWTDHSIADSYTERLERQRHAHAKPVSITKRLILATTKRGDVVLDPAAGGFGVLEACLATGRKFIGCDIAGLI